MSDLKSVSSFSSYGFYTITDNLELTFPEIAVRIEKIGEHVFSYIRKDAEDNIVKKIIPTNSSELTLEISPIGALNYPARRTNYVYLDLGTPVFLSENSAASIFVRCPIEIGIFLVHDNHKDSLDCFTCDPVNSRFSLYGSPESGTLCKYAQSEIVESYDDSIPFINGVLKIDMKNDLDKGLSISKIVFPMSDNSVYYKNSKAIIDSLTVVLKKKLTLEILDVVSNPVQIDWTKSPTYERNEHVKRIDMGVD